MDDGVDLPDIRIVTVSVPIEDGAVGEVEIDASGCGHYEALGMLMAAVIRMALPVELLDDDDDETDDE